MDINGDDHVPNLQDRPQRARIRMPTWRYLPNTIGHFVTTLADGSMETQRQWSERAIARTTPALFGLFSVVTLAADILIEQRGGMAPRTAAWYDKTSPSFADAIALVRRHLWVQQGTFYAVRARARIDKNPAPLVPQDARHASLRRLIVQSRDG